MGKKRQYRIVQTNDGFFTQTRTKGLFFWNDWLCYSKYNIENYNKPLRFPYESFEEASKYIGLHINMIYNKEKGRGEREILNIFEV